jgi:hypothetical protein
MGFLYYGDDSYPIEIDDRQLSHLKVALLSLLRANKSVAFTVAHSAREGSGRDTLWITPTTDIRFHFLGSRPMVIDEVWVRAIMATADTPAGMRLISEREAHLPYTNSTSRGGTRRSTRVTQSDISMEPSLTAAPSVPELA